MRKPIAMSESISGTTQSRYFMVICDDGTIWSMNTDEKGWLRIIDIPQDEEPK